MVGRSEKHDGVEGFSTAGNGAGVVDTKLHEQVQIRLGVLRTELEKGQAELQKVESQRTYLRETVLRISGAIQVLEELLAEGQPPGQNRAAGPGETQPATAPANEGNA